MLKLVKQRIATVAFLIVLQPLPTFAKQQPIYSNPAPLPTQIISAKRIFISNAGEERDGVGDLDFDGGPDRAYNQFCAAMTSWGRYEVVGVPSQADLVLEVRLASVRDSPYYMLRLIILDPKTHTKLWTFGEHAEAGGRQKARDASFDRAMNLLVNDLKELVARPVATPDARVR